MEYLSLLRVCAQDWGVSVGEARLILTRNQALNADTLQTLQNMARLEEEFFRIKFGDEIEAENYRRLIR